MKRGVEECKKEHQNQTVFLKNAPRIIGSYSIAGGKEGKGPLGNTFHRIVEDEYFGEKTHEAAEQKMFENAIEGAIRSSGKKPSEIDMMMSGDLLNQITSSSFAARSFDIAFVGLYGACSTMALTLGMGACMVDAGYMKNVVVSAGSHFATAERQYRTPLELGSQKPPQAQWTVTGCGACVLSGEKNTSASAVKVDTASGSKSKTTAGKKSKAVSAEKNTAVYDPASDHPRITAVTFGKVQDWGTKDVNNMGAAMAPSAASTIVAHFRDTKRTPADYDAIFTGDLGKLGENILRDLLASAGYPVDANYSDCGRMIYDHSQHSFQGGSGCGCSAVVLNGFIMNKFKKGDFKRVLFVATGALLSPVSSFQGNTIPGIAHAIVIESK